MVNHQKWADFVKTGTVSKPNKQHKQWIEVYAQFSCPMHMSRTCPVLDGVIWTRRGRHRVGVILGSQPTSPWVTRMAQRGALGCVAGRAAGRAWHPLRHGTVGRSGAEKADAVALGVCGHRNRVGVDSYQLPLVVYGSARKPKVPKMGRLKGPAQTFQV